MGRSNKRGAGNRAANEEETKNKPKLVSAPAIPAGFRDLGPRIVSPWNVLGTRHSPRPQLQPRSRRSTPGNRDGVEAEEHSSPVNLALSLVSLLRRKAPPRLGDTPRGVLEYWVGLFV